MREVTLIGPPESNGGVGQYTSDFADAMDWGMRVRRFEVGLNPISHLWLAVAAARDDTDAVHIQFVYSFLGPAGVFSFLFFPLLYVLTRVKSKQLVLTLHEVWDESDTDSPPKRLYAQFIHTLLYLCSDEVTFLSENAEESFHRNGWVGETHVVPHGVNRNAMRDLDDARERFGFDEDDLLVSQHAYVNPRKGIETFLQLAEGLPEYEFLLAGGPRTEEHEGYFEKLCASAPENVTITGVLDEEGFHAAFNATDIVVLPYKNINQSGIFNWCAAYEIPVVANSIPYFNELSSHWDYPITVSVKDMAEGRRVITEIIEGVDYSERCYSEYLSENSMSSVANWFRENCYRTAD